MSGNACANTVANGTRLAFVVDVAVCSSKCFVMLSPSCRGLVKHI